MQLSRSRLGLLVGIVVFAVSGVAQASVKADSLRIRKGITQAANAGWLKPEDVQRYRRDVGLAVTDSSRLPRARGAVVASLLNEIARQRASYLSPRALALFTMLEANLSYLETHILPWRRIDIAGADSVVYRWFAGKGFQFHPLANFGVLNADLARNDQVATRQLVDALVARGVPRGPALRWEYYFPFNNGSPPWTSGMAQAVAAQALSRAATVLSDQTLLQAAGRAYAAVPAGLIQQLSAGPWIRLYSFDRLVVLNAQLQAIVSLNDYAQATGDANAAGLAASMTVAAQALLPRFDTGYWSLYSLGGAEAPLEYQKFVTQLLVKLAQQTQDPVWQDAATRFYAYVKEPPQIGPTPLGAPVTLYPKPADNFLDAARVTFTLSKRSRVTLAAGGVAVSATLNRGTQTLTWKPGTLAPGSYTGQLTAVDLAGNKSTVQLDQPFVVAWDTAPPQIQAQLQGTTLNWAATDPGTPWLKLRIVLRGGATPTVVELGRSPLQGSAEVTLPPGTWQATLGAQNSAGLWATQDLGALIVPGA
ncbi:MAG: D-glucuronyl C5-epimerase family protein [Gaiellaceae bacterium]